MTLVKVGVWLSLLPFCGCGFLPFFQTVLGFGSDPPAVEETTITGQVTTASPTTGMPMTLSGTVSGHYEGTYQENILEVYFDANGAPLAAVSRSEFSFNSPQQGTVASLNLIVVRETLMSNDATGAAIPVGLRTGSTGEIIYGTGDYEGVTGQLHTDSTILFGGGDLGLGSLTCNLDFNLTDSTGPPSN